MFDLERRTASGVRALRAIVVMLGVAAALGGCSFFGLGNPSSPPPNTPNTPGSSSDAQWSNVVLLMHMDGTGESFTESKKGLTVTDDSHATQVAGPSGFGNTAQIDATHYGVSVPNSTDWTIGTGAYTGELRVLLNTLPATGAYTPLLSTMEVSIDTNWDFSLHFDGTSYLLDFYYTNDANGNNVSVERTSNPLTGVTTGSWHAAAFTYDGTNLRFFFDGKLVGTSAISGGIGPDTHSLPLYFGSTNSGSTPRILDGQIDEVRLTKGVCRYTADYVPGADPFPNS